MDNLVIKSDRKIQNIDTNFERFLVDLKKFKSKLTAIKGARGTGKTTLLLQLAKKLKANGNKVLYVALDDLFFIDNNLYELAEEFRQNGGTHLLLDEVHKYPGWSREIKLLYDDFDDLNIIFTSSSILNLIQAESDLSRRLVSYTLPELSLREFIALEKGIMLPHYSLTQILENHENIAFEILKSIKPIAELNTYLKIGQYPYYKEDKIEYYNRLINTINLIMEIDLSAIENIDYQNIVKFKKLLFAISTSVPFTPNVTKLSEKIGLSRAYLIKAFHLLEKAHLVTQLFNVNKGMSALNKPGKIYMRNTNIMHALSGTQADIGNIRETFFLNQIQQLKTVRLPDKGDFELDGLLFEIGGKNKTQKQLAGQINAFIIKDNIESGYKNTIPLWLFGFLY